VTRQRINAYLWVNNFPAPPEICDREPLLKDYGIFRRLNNGNFEFISMCDPRLKDFYSMNKEDLKKILGEKE
jgi:hypothetical protein